MPGCTCPICQGVILDIDVGCTTLDRLPDTRTLGFAARALTPDRRIIALGIPTRSPEVVVCEYMARLAIYLDGARS